MASIRSVTKNHLSSHLKSISLTRNQRFKEALRRNHSKIKKGGAASGEKKLKELENRAKDIKLDADRWELLEWIREIQVKLGYTNKRFAEAVGVSLKTVVNWRLKVGYLPSIKNFRRLLELEKLTRISVKIHKNHTYFIKEKAAIKVVIK